MLRGSPGARPVARRGRAGPPGTCSREPGVSLGLVTVWLNGSLEGLVVLLPVGLHGVGDLLRGLLTDEQLLEGGAHGVEHRGRRPVGEELEAVVLDQLLPAL